MSMTLIHSAQTQLAAAAESDPLLNLAGAFFIASAHREDPDLWVPVSADKLDKILSDENEDRRPLHVLGSSEELILRELYSRFPSKYGCRIRRYEDFTRHKAEKHYRRGHRHEWKEIEVPVVWVKLSRPYLSESEVESREQLERIVQEIGPVLLEEDTAKGLFPEDALPVSNQYHIPSLSERAEAYGFVALERAKLDLWQISYNPDVPRQRSYRQAVAAYEKRMEGELPKELRHALMANLSPARWGHHPYSNAGIRGPELYKYPGWNHQVPVEFSVSEVLAMRDFNLKLDKRPWWREDGNYTPNFKSTVERCLPYVHGIEAHARTIESEWRSQVQREYTRYCERVQEHNANPPETPDPQEPWKPIVLKSYEAFAKDYGDSHRLFETRPLRDLCRWLRREARALKLAMPKPPRQPKPPRKVRHGKIR